MRTIKKYPNRRLYDTEDSKYITLEDISVLVTENKEFVVIDSKTESDLTRNILLQIIIEKEQFNVELDQEYEVPKWYKNTAKWAFHEKITEREFLDSLEHLINKKIITYDVKVNVFDGFSDYNDIVTDKNLSVEDKVILNDTLFAPLMSGYRGATFDGESVYFAPYYNNYDRNGIMVKYDTTLPFDDVNSWNVFNLSLIHK